jgi:hypothetical protein
MEHLNCNDGALVLQMSDKLQFVEALVWHFDKLKLVGQQRELLDSSSVWAENAQYPAVPVSLLGLNFSP